MNTYRVLFKDDTAKEYRATNHWMAVTKAMKEVKRQDIVGVVLVKETGVRRFFLINKYVRSEEVKS